MTVLFFILGEKLMLMGYTSKSDSYETVLGYAFRCKFKKVVDYIFTFLLVASASTMFSGCGAFFNQMFGIPVWLGSLVITVLTFFITVMGIKGIMAISSIEIPLLVIITGVMAINSIDKGDILKFTLINEISDRGMISAIFSSIIYVSYNLVMSFSILPALGNSCKNRKEIKRTAFFSGIIIGTLGYIIYLALLVNYDKIQGVEIPILTLAGISQGLIYGVMFVLAVLSTAVGSLYGVYARFDKNTSLFALICAGAYLFSLVGFSNLVKNLYFVMGILGIFLIFMLIIGHNKSRSFKKDV
jgi:uncharacterized membrane protein YkvI